MKTIRFILTMVVLTVALGLVSGCATNYGTVATGGDFVRFVDVYVSEGNQFTLTGGVEPKGPILVFKGDRVIFNNLNKQEVILDLPKGMFEPDERMIEPDKLLVKPNKRVILNVIAEGDLTDEIGGKAGDQIIDGNPNMKVGEEP